MDTVDLGAKISLKARVRNQKLSPRLFHLEGGTTKKTTTTGTSRKMAALVFV